MFWFKKKRKIEGEDFLNGVTDIHCHLLPGVDDGFNSLSSSFELLRMEEEVGVKRIYFTPHAMGENGAVVDPLSFKNENKSKTHHSHKVSKYHENGDSQNFKGEFVKKNNDINAISEDLDKLKREIEEKKIVSSVVNQAYNELEYDSIDLLQEFKKERIGGYSDSHLTRKFEYFKKMYNGQIDIRLAAEYMMNKEFLDKVKNKDLLTYADGHHVLVETSYFFPPLEMDEILYTLKIEGYSPILAHPERYKYMTRDNYESLKEKGIEFQLNYLSLTGYYGKNVLTRALDLLDSGMYEYTGSDYHRTSTFSHHAYKLSLNRRRTEAFIKLFENNEKL